MSEADNTRQGFAPSAWIERWLRCLPPGASVLDVACGSGRHVRLALSLGHRVLGVDRDAQALAGLPAQAEQRLVDLEQGPWPFAGESFDAVVIANYLFRPRHALFAGLLAPGGALIHETFAVGQAEFGRPSNPAFLLQEGELFTRARSAGLVVVAYESGHVAKPARVQRICAVRPPVDSQRFALG